MNQEIGSNTRWIGELFLVLFAGVSFAGLLFRDSLSAGQILTASMTLVASFSALFGVRLTLRDKALDEWWKTSQWILGQLIGEVDEEDKKVLLRLLQTHLQAPLKRKRDHDATLDVRLPSFSGHPISTDLVSVGEDVHCEFVKEEVHPGVPA